MSLSLFEKAFVTALHKHKSRRNLSKTSEASFMDDPFSFPKFVVEHPVPIFLHVYLRGCQLKTVEVNFFRLLVTFH